MIKNNMFPKAGLRAGKLFTFGGPGKKEGILGNNDKLAINGFSHRF